MLISQLIGCGYQMRELSHTPFSSPFTVEGYSRYLVALPTLIRISLMQPINGGTRSPSKDFFILSGVITGTYNGDRTVILTLSLSECGLVGNHIRDKDK